MGALLGMIPFKDWIYGAIIVALIAFGLHYKHLETEVHQTAVVAKAAIVEVKKDTQVAQSTETTNALIYKQAVAIPAVADLGVVCKRTGGGTLPAPSAAAVPAAGNATPDSGVGPAYDPTGPALTRARSADAQIAYLQGRIAELEAEMKGAP